MTRCHDCANAYLARAEEEVCRQLVTTKVDQTKWIRGVEVVSRRALDVGAGTSGAGRRILAGWDYTGIDLVISEPENSITHENVTQPGFPERMSGHGHFDLILCKRVLCQMTDEEVSSAVTNMYELLRPGGHLLVCEPWRAEREALCKLRQLPDPKSGGKGVDSRLIETAVSPWVNSKRLADVPVAPDYVLWTRAFWPMLQYEFRPGTWGSARTLQEVRYLPYDDPRRELYPAFPPEVQGRFAFYRARLWRKA